MKSKSKCDKNDHNKATSHEVEVDDDRPIELPICHKPTTSRNFKPGQVVNAAIGAAPASSNDPSTDGSEWHKPRDPRFDPRCSGSNDLRHFVRNYAFVDDLRRNELHELERALRSETNPDKKVKIKQTITRIKNKMVERDNKNKKIELISKLKAQTHQGSIGQGKYKNIRKSEIKKMLVVKKFQQLKESGKLTKYLERKRKKLIDRDEKSLAP